MLNHHNHLHSLLHSELNELYLSNAIRFFGLSIISVFVPIFLMQQGFSLAQVMIFYIILNGAHALSVIPAARIAAKFGLKHTIMFSIPILLIFYGMLYTLEAYNWPLALLGVIYGINNALFWTAYHLDFCKASHSESTGKEIGKSQSIVTVARALGPLFGGLLIITVGFKIMFLVVAFLLFISITPLFLSKEIHEPYDMHTKDIFKKQKAKDTIGYVGYGIETGVGFIIWPIFIFYSIIGQKYATLGAISTFTTLISFFFPYIIGKFADKDKRKVLRFASIGNAILWGSKLFLTSISQVFVVDTAYGMTKTGIGVPLNALSYDKAKATDKISKHIIFREIVINAGRIPVFVLLVFMTDMIPSFIMAAGASLLYFLF